jgi:aminoglycoside 6'-N-acetyltransferase
VPGLRAIVSTPEVAAWWGRQPESFPFDDPTATRFTIVVERAVAGLIQFSEEAEPDYRHASIDLFLDPRRHGRGLGTDAVKTLVRHLVDVHGHHRVTIDPAKDNTAAIRCYEKAGFQVVGVMRSAWRDSRTGRWRDAVLMELVAPIG